MREGNWLRRVAESLSHLGAQLEKQINAARDANEAQHETCKQIASSLSELRLPEKERAKRDAYNEKNYHLQVLLTLGTWLAFLAAAVYAHIAARQLTEMNETYSEMKAQTYISCINAQAVQATFFEAQRASADTHAASMATIQQAAVGNDSQKANITVAAKMPVIGNYVNRPLGIPFMLKNQGKSSASNFDFWSNAVLLEEGQTLRTTTHFIKHIGDSNFGAGTQIPQQSDDPRFRFVDIEVDVFDIYGKSIQPNSQKAINLVSGGKTKVFFYGHFRYTDITGTHTTRFCNIVNVMRAGEEYTPDKNVKTCFEYNNQTDNYFGVAGNKLTPDTRQFNVVPISCKLPEGFPRPSP